MDKKTILLTGAAGFIGSHVAQKLLNNGAVIVGVDNLNDYYDPALKKARLSNLKKHPNFHFHEIDIADNEKLTQAIENYSIDAVCHLAAQAGVRYSLEEPMVYEESNVKGTLTILEYMRHHKIRDIVYASSSSVYGAIREIPFREDMKLASPISLYAATKITTELFAYTYHHLYGLHCIGLRFFTVYGPWGRPDMAYFLFTKAISEGKPIKVYNNGNMKRDFTYIDDVVDGISQSLEKLSELEYEVFNLGCSDPVHLGDFITTIEKALGKEAQKEYLPLQPGDVIDTYADVSKAKDHLGYNPSVKITEGISQFVAWYQSYYGET